MQRFFSNATSNSHLIVFLGINIVLLLGKVVRYLYFKFPIFRNFFDDSSKDDIAEYVGHDRATQ